MNKKFIPLQNLQSYTPKEMVDRSQAFFDQVNSRRTVRTFSKQKIPQEVIENAISAASTAPSGANMQPWFFAIIKDSEIKKTIRIEAEKEEREFYSKRATEEWLRALEPFETDENKPFLENAPYLIAVFERKFSIDGQNNTIKHYYTKESVGLAAGILLTALHNSGIATLTHTPSPMNFLNKILKRPKNEKPFLIIVAGVPEEGTLVPNIKRKKFEEIASIY